jgi:hypothetical protein
MDHFQAGSARGNTLCVELRRIKEIGKILPDGGFAVGDENRNARVHESPWKIEQFNNNHSESTGGTALETGGGASWQADSRSFSTQTLGARVVNKGGLG